MEKFALLNLLKALDGLQKPQNAEKPQNSTPAEGEKKTPADKDTGELPNIMYETLIRHESLSNRLKNRRPPA